MGCICHLANLCVAAAVKSLPVNVDDMLVNIYYHFQKSSKRKEEYKEYEEFTDTEPLKILKHASTRWLSLERCVKRTLAQWPALESYFNSHLESDKAGQVKQLAELLVSAEVRLYFMFLSFILGPMNEFNTAFQMDECSIGLMIPEMNRFLRKFLAKFVKMSVIRDHSDDLTKVPYQVEEHQHNNEYLAVGSSARLFLSDIKENLTVEEENKFFNSVRCFYVKIVKKMMNKFPFGDEVLCHLSILNLNSEMKPESVRILGQNYNFVNREDTDDLVEEATDYCLAPKSELPKFKEGDRTDVYWLSVFKLKTGTGKFRFSLLGEVMKPLISIPNSNADSESVFSMVRKIHTDFRSELDHDTLCSLLSSKINLDGCCYNTEITLDHLKAAKKATWSYVQEHSASSLCQNLI